MLSRPPGPRRLRRGHSASFLVKVTCALEPSRCLGTAAHAPAPWPASCLCRGELPTRSVPCGQCLSETLERRRAHGTSGRKDRSHPGRRPAAVPGSRPSSCVRFSCPTRTPSVLTSSPSYDTVRSPSRPRGRSLAGGSGRCAGHSSVGACSTRPAPRRRAGAALVGPHAPEAVSFPRPVCSQLGHRLAGDEGEQLGLVSASHGDSLSLGTLSKSI